jgi:hypothetical protein
MKTERRHELETNKLALEIDVWREKLRPYTSGILFGLAALLGVYAVMSYWNSHNAGREQQAWLAYEKALLQGSADYSGVQLVAASDEFAGTRMQEWAYMAWADRQLRMAAEMFLVNRDAAKEKLSAIAAVYDQYSTDASDPEIRNRAMLGLARVSEMQGRLDDARRQYGEVQGALGAIAAARLKDLEAKDFKATSEWLATATLPKPPAPTGPGLPGTRPNFGSEVPAADKNAEPFDPARTMEEILGGTAGDDPLGAGRYDGIDAGKEAAPAGDAGKESAPADEPATAESPAAPANDAPTTDAPAAETPAATEPPVATDAAPADETPAKQ